MVELLTFIGSLNLGAFIVIWTSAIFLVILISLLLFFVRQMNKETIEISMKVKNLIEASEVGPEADGEDSWSWPRTRRSWTVAWPPPEAEEIGAHDVMPDVPNCVQRSSDTRRDPCGCGNRPARPGSARPRCDVA